MDVDAFSCNLGRIGSSYVPRASLTADTAIVAARVRFHTVCLIYEPYGLMHQWGNPGDEPLTFLAFNINPEGVAAVLPGAPAKSQ